MKYPPYRIETARLVLRCWNPEDAPLGKAAFAVEGIDRVEIHHDPANERSGRVPEALGEVP